MTGTGDEHRKFKRYDVDSVHGKMLFSSDINILNISMDGAAIATTQRLVIDRIYSLKLKFDDSMLTLKGKVVWSMLSHSKKSPRGEVVPVYRAGIRFTNTLTDAAEQLISYIEKNRSGNIEKRMLGVRFKIPPHADARIDVPCEYDIRKISLSGMLIETDIIFPVDTLHDMEISLDGTVLNIVGRIANQTETRVDEIVKFDVGIEFISMPEEDKRVLISYIDAMESRK